MCFWQIRVVGFLGYDSICLYRNNAVRLSFLLITFLQRGGDWVGCPCDSPPMAGQRRPTNRYIVSQWFLAGSTYLLATAVKTGFIGKLATRLSINHGYKTFYNHGINYGRRCGCCCRWQVGSACFSGSAIKRPRCALPLKAVDG